MKIYHFQIQKTNYYVCAHTHFQAEICLAASGVDLDKTDEFDDCNQIDEIFWPLHTLPNANSKYTAKSAEVVLGFERDDTFITFDQYMQTTNIGPHVFYVKQKAKS